MSGIEEIFKVWQDGGWVMFPLAATALVMYLLGIQLLLYFRRRAYRRVALDEWLGWVREPERARGEIGEIIRYTQDEVQSLMDIQNRFAEIHSAKIPTINRRLAFLRILVTVAPLMGLLGTVLGMIQTFAGISLGGGNLVDMISSGISKALITTETGLLIALPGYFLVYWIRGRRNDYLAFLAHLESATMQEFQKRFPERAA